MARPHVPSDLGCVIDAALTGDAAAVAVAPKTGTTIIVVTHALVACPALSKIASDTYVATIGAGVVAANRESSVLGSARWAKARRYLARDPLAIAYEGGTRRALAVAQPDPIDAWVTIDAIDIDAIEHAARTLLERWKKLDIRRSQSQLLVRSNKLDIDEMVALVSDLLRAADAAPESSPPPLACVPTGHGITSCQDGNRYTVVSIAELMRELAKSDARPLIASGDIVGIELVDNVPLLLQRGDILLGVDSQRITNVDQLRELARHVGDHAALAVRRGGIDIVIDLRE